MKIFKLIELYFLKVIKQAELFQEFLQDIIAKDLKQNQDELLKIFENIIFKTNLKGNIDIFVIELQIKILLIFISIGISSMIFSYSSMVVLFIIAMFNCYLFEFISSQFKLKISKIKKNYRKTIFFLCINFSSVFSSIFNSFYSDDLINIVKCEIIMLRILILF